MGKKSISAQSSNSAVCFCCCFFVFLCFIYFASSYSRGVLRWALFVLSLSFSLAFYFRLLRTRRRRRFRVCVWEGRTTTYHALAHWLSGFHDLLLSPIVSHAHFFVFIWGKCVDNIFLIFFTKNQILFRDFPGGQEFFFVWFRCEPKRNTAPRAGKQFSSVTVPSLPEYTFRFAMISY